MCNPKNLHSFASETHRQQPNKLNVVDEQGLFVYRLRLLIAAEAHR